MSFKKQSVLICFSLKYLPSFYEYFIIILHFLILFPYLKTNELIFICTDAENLHNHIKHRCNDCINQLKTIIQDILQDGIEHTMVIQYQTLKICLIQVTRLQYELDKDSNFKVECIFQFRQQCIGQAIELRSYKCAETLMHTGIEGGDMYPSRLDVHP